MSIATIYTEWRPVGWFGWISEHSLLVFLDQTGTEYYISAGPSVEFLSDGSHYVSVHAGTLLGSHEEREPGKGPSDYGSNYVELPTGLSVEAAWSTVMQMAERIHSERFPYWATSQNCKTTIGNLLYLIGVDYGRYLPHNDSQSLFEFLGWKGELAFDYSIVGTAEADYLCGRGGNQTFQGNGGDDTLIGGSGNDVLAGGGDNDLFLMGPSGDDEDPGADVVDGGSGYDTVSFFGMPGGIVLSNWQVVRTPGPNTTLAAVEKVIGTAFVDNVYSWSGILTFDGGAGGDIIRGGRGADILSGGDDNDVIYGYREDLSTTERASTLQVGKTLNGDGGDDQIFGSNAADKIDGGSESDTIYANGGADEIRGGDGTNTLYGGGDSDTFILAVGSSNTVYGGEEGANVVRYEGAGPGSLTIQSNVASAGSDLIYQVATYYLGSAGDTVHVNKATAGSVNAGGGDDVFTVGSSARTATLRGDGGNDRFDFTGFGEFTGSITAWGGADADTLIGKTNGYVNLNGDGGNDTIYVRHRNDANGGADNDTIFMEGNQIDVWGGSGADTLIVRGGAIKRLHDFSSEDTLKIEDYQLLKNPDGSFVAPAYKNGDAIFMSDKYGAGLTVAGVHLTLSDIMII